MSELDEDKSMRQLKLMIGIFLGILILYLMKELSNLLVPLVYALFFAVLFQPLVKLLQRFLNIKMAIIVTTLLTIAVFFSIGFGLYNVVQAFIKNSGTILNNITEELLPTINEYAHYFGLDFKIGEFKEVISKLLKTDSFWSASGSFFNSIGDFTAEVLITILYFTGLLGAIYQYDEAVSYVVGAYEGHEKNKSLRSI